LNLVEVESAKAGRGLREEFRGEKPKVKRLELVELVKFLCRAEFKAGTSTSNTGTYN